MKRAGEEERCREEPQKHLETMNKMAVSTYLSLVTLNINGLSSPIKRHRVIEGVKKKPKTDLYAAYKRHFRWKDTHR